MFKKSATVSERHTRNTADQHGIGNGHEFHEDFGFIHELVVTEGRLYCCHNQPEDMIGAADPFATRLVTTVVFFPAFVFLLFFMLIFMLGKLTLMKLGSARKSLKSAPL